MSDGEGLSELGRAALEYVRMGFAVVPLRPRSKEPATRHGLKDWTDDEASVRGIWAAHPDLNVGIVCGAPSGGLVALDLDSHGGGPDGYDALREWEAANGALPETCSAVTGSGGLHLLFRAGREVRPSANPALAVDVRGDGSYIVAPPSVHPGGRRYEWEVPPDEAAPADADERVLAFVESVRPASGRGAPGVPARYELPDAIAEGGRNDAIFRAGASMRGLGMDAALIPDALAGLNAARCRPPLPADEVARIAASVLALPEGRSGEFRRASGGGDAGGGGEAPAAPPFVHRGKVAHNEFARLLIEEDGACRVGDGNGPLAVWTGLGYEMGNDAVFRAITRHHDAAKTQERREVLEYVRLMAPVVPEAPPGLIAFRNGVLDVETGAFGPVGRGEVIANVIPHDWDPSAACPDVDALLGRVACGDPDTLMNLAEVLGLCMFRSNRYSQCPVLLGSGSNGKSTFLKMAKALLGGANYSTLDLDDLGRNPFQVGHLAGRLANIGDDISNEFLGGGTMSLFKKVVSGEDVYADVKGGVGYHFRPYCTLVFSANEFPRMGDSSDGVMRRLFPIEFRARFSREDAGYDPNVVDRVTSPEACRYMAALGVEGLRSVMANRGFTPNAASERVSADIRESSDSVLQWISDDGVSASTVARRPVAEVYRDYSQACQDAGGRPVGRKVFAARMRSATGLESRVMRMPGGRVARCFLPPVEETPQVEGGVTL